MITLDHFRRSAAEIGAHGDNDTLPFDIDTRFVRDCGDALSDIAFNWIQHLSSSKKKDAREALDSLQIYSERILVPNGPSGFRITTKIHPFWNVFLNGVGIAIAEKLEPTRSSRAMSYRFNSSGEELFDRNKSWINYRKTSLESSSLDGSHSHVLQADVSSYYERIYHHRLQNLLGDLFENDWVIPLVIDRLLVKFSSGRSFGLPIGGQCARILAEVMMTPIDQALTNSGLDWYRFVDDFTIVCPSRKRAYEALSVLSNALADFGLSLNKTKTSILRSRHFIDAVELQIGATDHESRALREIDLHFDPYSDSTLKDYEKLRSAVQSIDVAALLSLETKKSQPDNFIITQVSRTLKYQSPLIAESLCETLLSEENLHAFRGSWATIMRGVAAVRGDEDNSTIFTLLDELIDQIPEHSSHLLAPEGNLLHYMKTIRYSRNELRGQFVQSVFQNTSSQMVQRACVECWHKWRERSSFVALRNRWQQLAPETQRLCWYAASNFGDDGKFTKTQLKAAIENAWRLGIEIQGADTFASVYSDWVSDGNKTT